MAVTFGANERMSGSGLTKLLQKLRAAYGGSYKKSTISSATATVALAWSTEYVWSVTPSSITFSAPSATYTDTRPAEIKISFTTGSSAPSVTFPNGWLWANGEKPAFETGTYYEINLGRNASGVVTAVYCGFKTA